MTKNFSEIYQTGEGEITVDVSYGEYDGDFRKSIVGGDDNDTLTARGFLSTVDGGAGDDLILVDASSAGVNLADIVLIGGGGRDTFAFMPGDQTISASIKDFNLDEDTMVLVTLTADGELAVLAAVGDNEIAINEAQGIAALNAVIDAGEAAASIANTSTNSFRYDAEKKLAALNLSDRGIDLTFENLDDGDRLFQMPVRVIDNHGNWLRNTTASRKFLSESGLSIYYNYVANGDLIDNDGDWLFVTSDYEGDIWLGGIDLDGNTVEGLSNDSIVAIQAVNDTVGGRMLAGNSKTNFIYAGNGGNSLWGGVAEGAYLVGGTGADTFIVRVREDIHPVTAANVGENDVVHLKNLTYDDIFVSDGGESSPAVLNPKIYLSGITSDPMYWEYDFEFNVYLNKTDAATDRIFFFNKSEGSSFSAWRDSNAWTTTFRLDDGYQLQYDYLMQNWNVQKDGSWKPLALDTGALMMTEIDGRSALKINSLYQGNIWLDRSDYFNAIQVLDASNYVVEQDIYYNDYRVLVGNALDNSIIAGAGGISMWGGSDGNDTLVGGSGADTFHAGQGEGRNVILNSADDDVIMLWNIAASDFASLEPNLEVNADEVHLSMRNGDGLDVIRAEGAVTATFVLADYTTWQYSYSDQSWSLSTPVHPEQTNGLIMENDNITVTSEFEGNVVLGGVDWNGNEIEGWKDESIIKINAESDTVSGRLLIGNALINSIIAGTGGASLWGGGMGYYDSYFGGIGLDYLYGGAGADTFIAGKGEGYIDIYDCGDEDIVVLYNINATDITSEEISRYGSENVLRLGVIHIWYDTDTTSTIVRFADGSTKVYTHLVAGTPDGLKNYDGVLYVSPDYIGDVVLGGVDWNDNEIAGWSDSSVASIDALSDMAGGRLLMGNALDNDIRAGRNGALMWGGSDGSDYLSGGAGADTFVAGDGEGDVIIRDVGGDDTVFLHNINRGDLESVSLGGDVGSEHISMRTRGGSTIEIYRAEDATGTAIRYADGETRSFDYATGSWLSLFYDADELGDGFLTRDGTVFLAPNYVGDIYLGNVDLDGNAIDGWSDSSIANVDARGDTVGGRMLAGNTQDNEIYAGTGGASLWGGNGSGSGWDYDYLYGGAGADTFIVDGGAGNVSISNYSDEDVIVLRNITPSDILSAAGDPYWLEKLLNIVTNDGMAIRINYNKSATKTTLKYGNGETRTFNHAEGNWRDLFVDNNVPDGLTKVAGTVYVTSEYVGDVYLGDVDLNGNSIDGLSLTTSATIMARGDAVGGRMLAGNALNNKIYAGAGGASMWGGNGGSDSLYGGDGADTFIAGAGEGRIYIYDYGDEDIVVFHNINISDITDVQVGGTDSIEYLRITTNDGSNIDIGYLTKVTKKTTIRYADGETRTFDHVNGDLFDLFRNGDDTLPAGLLKLGNRLMVSPKYEGDVYLDDLNDSSIATIDARQNTVGGGMLAGDAESNVIRAGSGGVSMWGGEGSGDDRDYLFGGAGADTFIVSGGIVEIYNCYDNDIVVLRNVNVDDISSVSIIDDGYIRLVTTNSDVIFIRQNTQRATKTTIQYDDGETRTFDYANGSVYDLANISETSTLPAGLSTSGSTVTVSSSYVGDVVLGGVDWTGASLDGWSDESIININASSDTVAGRILAGDAQSNEIRAGSGGASMWGGTGGYDYLYGGAGVDTFIACKNDGNVAIQNCGDEDIVVLHDITPDDIKSEYILTDSNRNAVSLVLQDENSAEINIGYNTDTTKTTVQYADGSTKIYNHIGVSPADGLTNYDSNIYVLSAYVGDVVLEGVDWNGNSVGTWSDTSIININAENDTIGGRLLIGNRQSNEIYAGSGGDTLWGGGRNAYASDYLYGGDGADVFVAGSGEGWISINDCADDDLVLLHNINLGDITWTLDDSYTYSGYLEATALDVRSLRIRYDKEESTVTTVQYADGSRQRFDHSSGTWSTV